MRQRIQSTVLLFALFLFSSCNSLELKEYKNTDELVEEARSEIDFISQEELKAAIDNEKQFYLIDCREKTAYDSASIPGAIHIPRGLLEFQVSTKAHDHNRNVYIFCEDGSKSALAATVLPRLKYSNVKSLKDGFKAWKQNYPDMVELEPDGDETATNVPAPASGGGCGG
ncbi:MAG: rhodanese-like domain-containing protein [Bacteroidales bacterium]|nr:rhodanese-like domain-containing protein [Bacteroidales bacterium]